MRTENLLISSQATMAIIIAAACVFFLALFFYGIFRKFTQMGWLPWQIPIIFGIVYLIDYVPKDLNPNARYFISLSIFLLGAAAVLGIGALVRFFIHRRMRPASAIVSVFNRLLGGITAMLGFAVIVLAIACFALPLCEYCIPPAQGILSVVFENPIWKAVSGHAFDFFLVAIFTCAVQAGYRVGFGRGLLTLFMCAGTLASLVLALFLTVRVPFLHSIVHSFERAIAGTANAVVAKICAYGLVALLLFLLLFTVLSLIGFLLHKLIRRCRYVRVLGFIDGALCSVLFFAIVLALASGIDYAVGWLAYGGLRNAVGDGSLDGIVRSVETYAGSVAQLFRASPFSRVLFDCNLLNAFGKYTPPAGA